MWNLLNYRELDLTSLELANCDAFSKKIEKIGFYPNF